MSLLLQSAREAYTAKNYPQAFAHAQALAQETQDPALKAEALKMAGVVMLHGNQLNEAEAFFLQAQKFNPLAKGIQKGLGTVYNMQRNFARAVLHYTQALALDKNDVDIIVSLASVYAEIGQFQDAEKLLDLAVEKYPTHHLTISGRIRYGFYMYPWEQWDEKFPSPSRDDKLTDTIQLSIIVFRTIHAWLKQDFKQFKRLLQRIHQLYNRVNHSEIEVGNETIGEQVVQSVRNAQAYRNFLRLLPQTPQASCALDPQANTLWVLGDSHGVIPHRQKFDWQGATHQVHSRLVMGVKAWHLTQRKNNLYRTALLREMSQLPTDATVVLSVGEIDCRTDEGIWLAAQKQQKDPFDLIESTFKGFFERVAAVQNQRKILLMGIPKVTKKRLETLSSDQHERYNQFIMQVNIYLAEQCQAVGWGFVDVFKMTQTERDEVGASAWHLESVHLKPTALAHGLQQYFIPAA